MLVTSIFSLSHNVFNPIKNKSNNLSILILSFANIFNLDQCEILSFGKELTNGKILDGSKLKAFADDKIYVTDKMISPSDKVENIVRKGEKAGYQHFLLFLQCFQKPSFSGLLKVRIVWERINKQYNFSSVQNEGICRQHNTILAVSKMKAFADNTIKFKCALKIEICSVVSRKHCEKRQNAGNQHLHLSHSVYKSLFS